MQQIYIYHNSYKLPHFSKIDWLYHHDHFILVDSDKFKSFNISLGEVCSIENSLRPVECNMSHAIVILVHENYC